MGIEPTSATAEWLGKKALKRLKHFGYSLACQLEKADLVIANNVLAHVPDINDFAGGIAALLKPDAQVSIEFPTFLTF